MNSFPSEKVVENVRRRKTMVTAVTGEQSVKRQSKIFFDCHKQFDTEDRGDPVSIYSLKKQELTFTKPVLLGYTIFELPKLFMYKTYCNKIQPYFREDNLINLNLDTDTLVLNFEMDNLITALEKLQEEYDMIDFANFQTFAELYDMKKERVVGKFKIET